MMCNNSDDCVVIQYEHDIQATVSWEERRICVLAKQLIVSQKRLCSI
jgi:hypothetical protein